MHDAMAGRFQTRIQSDFPHFLSVSGRPLSKRRALSRRNPLKNRFLPTMMKAAFEKHEDTTTYSHRGGFLG